MWRPILTHNEARTVTFHKNKTRETLQSLLYFYKLTKNDIV